MAQRGRTSGFKFPGREWEVERKTDKTTKVNERPTLPLPPPPPTEVTHCAEKSKAKIKRGLVKKTLPFPSSWVEILKKQIRNASSMFRQVMKSLMPQLKNILKSPGPLFAFNDKKLNSNEDEAKKASDTSTYCCLFSSESPSSSSKRNDNILYGGKDDHATGS